MRKPLDRIYLDSCVLNRPADDQSQPRIRAESIAVERILHIAAAGGVHWIASAVVEAELSRNPNRARREDSLRLMRLASEFVNPTRPTFEQASVLHANGFGPFNALHLSLAMPAGAGWLLTVDDRFFRKSAPLAGKNFPTVENPLDWIRMREPWLLQT